MKVRASTRQSPMQRMHPSFIISGVLGLDGTIASVLDLSLFVRAVSSDWGLVSGPMAEEVQSPGDLKLMSVKSVNFVNHLICANKIKSARASDRTGFVWRFIYFHIWFTAFI